MLGFAAGLATFSGLKRTILPDASALKRSSVTAGNPIVPHDFSVRNPQKGQIQQTRPESNELLKGGGQREEGEPDGQGSLRRAARECEKKKKEEKKRDDSCDCGLCKSRI